ncbi:MAG: hypothetical protein NTU88_09780, partial [Armatimonadetes bacterium]|nr:hypothetical protein [Armatimonadota bacterium]
MAKKDGMDRRKFLKTSVIALGGGLACMNAPGMAEAESQAKLPQTIDTTPPPPTPTRLSEVTHSLAQRGLSGEFGRSMVPAGVKLEDLMDVSGLTEEMKCAHAVRFIAERAPLRILPGERIVGSATYSEAVGHAIPIFGKSSVSHTTLGFDKVLQVGYKGLRKQIADRLSRGGLDDKGKDLLNALTVCLDAATAWHIRYVRDLRHLIASSSGEERAGYER